MRKIIVLLLLLFLSLGTASSETLLEQGIKAFRLSQYAQAEELFQKAISESPTDDSAHLYLGLLYQNMDRIDEAESVMKEGISFNGKHRQELEFNLANLYFSSSLTEKALNAYDTIIISGSEYSAEARLNKANLLLKGASYPEAVTEYQQFLQMKPDDEQAPKIRQLISLLTEKVAYDKEQARLEELRRQEDERRKAEEEARQKALLEDILGDLDNAGDDTKNYNAGSETIDDDFSDSDIEE